MMIPTSFSSEAPPAGSHMLPPFPSATSSFWETTNVTEQLRKLQDTIDLLKAVYTLQAELDAISSFKESDCPYEKEDNISVSSLNGENLLSSLECSKNDWSLLCKIFKVIEAKKIDVNVQESLSLETANVPLSNLTSQLAPFNFIACQTSSWEEMSVAVKLANKIQKSKRDKQWRKKKEACY